MSNLYRGHGRGRGLGHGLGFRSRGLRFNSNRPQPVPPQPDPIPDDLGTQFKSLKRDEIREKGNEPILITNAAWVGSYNWIGEVTAPKIVIPGAPPRWTPPIAPPQLTQDSGEYYRDVNAAYRPSYPLQAAALAVLDAAVVEPSEVDIMTCANSLRSLMEFVRNEHKTFRILVEIVGNTVFLIRRDGPARAFIPGVKGYGHTMPAAYTDWHPDVRGSVYSQRVLRYQLGGLQCLVRYEPDGYLPECAPDVSFASSIATRHVAGSGRGVEDLVTTLDSTSVARSQPLDDAESGLEVQAAGVNVPQSATFELKTRAASSKDAGEDLFDKFAIRLWLTQTPFLVTAYHERGHFNDIRVVDVSERVADWEHHNQSDVRKLVWLLEWIVANVNSQEDHQLELWRHEKDSLQLLKPGSEFLGALPLDVEDRWALSTAE